MQENSKNLLLIVTKLRGDSTGLQGESTFFGDLLNTCLVAPVTEARNCNHLSLVNISASLRKAVRRCVGTLCGSNIHSFLGGRSKGTLVGSNPFDVLLKPRLVIPEPRNRNIFPRKNISASLRKAVR